MAANTLASELARVQNIVRELEANMDHHHDLPPAARVICGELASRVDRSLRIARSWSESPGSPDGDGDTAGEAGGNTAHFKRRKGLPNVRKQMRLASVHDTAALDDGFSWRKYGQKEILGAKYPRSYFRCTHRNTQSCLATKQVQRADADPLLFDVVYHGAHTCVQAADQLQPQPGHEQSSPRVMETGGGIQAGLQPLSFTSTHAAGTDDFGGCCPLLSPTSFEWQLRSSQAAGAGMEFEQQFEDFFSSPPDAFQWDFPQDLYAAN